MIGQLRTPIGVYRAEEIADGNYQITSRYRADFPERLRFLWGTRTLRVIAQSDPDNRQERLHFMCEEEQQ